jgi:hypothetical protein
MSSNSEILERIARVDPVHTDTMRRSPTELAVQTIPFYRSYKLVEATVLLPQRPLRLYYLDNGKSALPLASSDDIYRANAEEELVLNEGLASAYLKFFVAHSSGGTRSVVEKPSELQWLAKAEQEPAAKELKATAAKHLHAPQVTAAPGSFHIVATVVEGQRLEEVTFEVIANGATRVKETRVLVEQLPVPHAL